ncbi:ATP-binding protein [Streptomyces sp. NPDC002490]|uniref:ATP-binding protein n=1 Tax=Streptomyces sp. NPDC002490 TaxID=3154416 RepID=UPI00332D0831
MIEIDRERDSRVQGERAEWTFPADPGAVRDARSAVRGQLGRWGLESLGDLTVLLVSELVTNSLRHATGPIRVRLVRPPKPPGALLVEVFDPQPGALPEPPRGHHADVEDEGGRGLRLVASTSSRWGTRPGRSGKTVWFELALPG